MQNNDLAGRPDLVPFASTSSPGAMDEHRVNCCICGVLMPPNDAHTCINCLKSQVDITEGISKQVTLFFCRGCGRYQRPPYVAVELESREMLALCLRKVKGLNKEVKLVDASFVWTEAHSRRIKLKLTVQKEVFHGAIIQQSFVVEFVVTNQQCTDCQKSYTDHVWNTNVQVRQRVKHKRTFYMLEQMILKHGVCDAAMGAKEMPGGLDFYWDKMGQARKLVQFLEQVCPMQRTESKRLISQDDKSNVYSYKHTFFVEIAPVCKDDLVSVDDQLRRKLGGCSPLLLCTRVTNMLHLLDPRTLQFIDLAASTYFQYPTPVILSVKQLTEYIVIDIEPMEAGSTDRSFMSKKKHQKLLSKVELARVTVSRAADMGSNDKQFEGTTHLGNILRAGDTVLGYDLARANIADAHATSFKGQGRLPDFVLVRKTYPARDKFRRQKRKFRLRELQKTDRDFGDDNDPGEMAIDDAPAKRGRKRGKGGRTAASSNRKKAAGGGGGDGGDDDDNDYEHFLRDLEEDPEMRAKVDLYAREPVAAMRQRQRGGDVDVDMDGNDEDEDDGFADVEPTVDELVDDLALATVTGDAIASSNSSSSSSSSRGMPFLPGSLMTSSSSSSGMAGTAASGTPAAAVPDFDDNAEPDPDDL